MAKYHCAKCEKLVGDINGVMRKRAVILCGECWKRASDAIEIADMAAANLHSSEESNRDALEFLKNAFHMT